MSQFTRKEFYELIWTKSIAEVVRRFDISHRELKLICAKKLIPIPNSLNRTSQIKKLGRLPEYHLDDDPIIVELRASGGTVNELRKKPQKNHHSLVIQARESLVRNSERYTRRELLSTGSGKLDIRVSKNMIERACNAMSNFLFKVESMGHSIEECNHGFCVEISSVKFPFSLREKRSYSYGKSDYGYNRRIETPAGILILQIGRWRGKDWSESKNAPLEEMFDKIISLLVTEAKKQIKYEKERKRRVKYKAFLDHVAKVKKEYRDRELEHFRDLMRCASRWYQANIMRDFLSDLRQQMMSQGNATSKKLNWIRWAEQKADWFDPTMNVKDKYLKKRDIETENLDMFRSDKVENKTYHYSSANYYRR